jgi:hypothetical protein
MKLTKKMRDEIAEYVLIDKFKEEFDAFEKKIGKIAVERANKLDPIWVKLWTNVENRPYMKHVTIGSMRYVDNSVENKREIFYFAAPYYGRELLEIGLHSNRSSEYKVMVENNTMAPSNKTCVFHSENIDDANLWDDYRILVMRYNEALKTLREVLYSFTTLEKLHAVFPDYAEAVAPVAKPSVPMIRPEDVKAKLSAVGIDGKLK